MKKENTHRAKKASDAQLDKIYKGVMTCEPAIAAEEMDQVADLVFSKERVIRAWRWTALLASKDGAFFSKMAEDPELAKVTAGTLESLRGFADTMRTMAALADCVSTRAAVACCNHEDFSKWSGESSEQAQGESAHG